MQPSPTSLTSTSPASGQPAIEFKDVRLGFDEGEILRGVTFAAQERETVILLGETGTGKTLLLKLASGLLRPDSGSIHVLGKDISTMHERDLLEARRQIGFVFQEGALFDSLTVGENVAYCLQEAQQPEEEVASRVQEVLQFVELAHTSDMLPSELSGGMRRRVSIARALITRPPIVLYDSPTAGLDPITSQTIISLILRLRDVYGVTALMATHRLQDGFGPIAGVLRLQMLSCHRARWLHIDSDGSVSPISASIPKPKKFCAALPMATGIPPPHTSSFCARGAFILRALPMNSCTQRIPISSDF